MIEEITGAHNEKIKYFTALKKKKYRYRYQRFLVEGVLLVEEALTQGVELERVLISTPLLQRSKIRDLLHRIKAQGISSTCLPQPLFKEVADTVHPQGILAIAVMPETEVQQAFRKRVLVVDGVGDPGNLGTLIRTAQAVGCDGILLMKETVDPYSPKVVRGAMGALFQQPLLFCTSADEAIHFLQERGFELVVAESQGKPFYSIQYQEPVALVVGSETQGVSPIFLEKARAWAGIPLKPGVDSLNVSLAAGIILYEIYRQKREEGGE